MTKKTKLKGFTLIEMLIVMVIIGILAVVLTESYITISKTALRIEQEKNISEESLILTQVFQAISDEATIDYDRYSLENIDLSSNLGKADKLYLTGGQWSGTSIYTEGENCLELDGNFKFDENGNVIPNNNGDVPSILDYSGCNLVLEDSEGNKTILSTSGKVVVSKVKFKIIPYNSDKYYFEHGGDNVINNIHQPAFWMFIHLYSPLYQPKGTNNVHQPLQLFFNLNL